MDPDMSRKYRAFVVHQLPALRVLDGVNVLPHERQLAAALYGRGGV